MRIIISKLFVMIQYSHVQLYIICIFIFFFGGEGVSNQDFFKIIIYFFTNYSCHQICGTSDQQVIKEYCIRLKTSSRSCKVNPLNLSLTVSIAGTNHKNYNFLSFDWFKKGLFSLIRLPSCYRTVLLLDSLLLDSLFSDSSKSQSHSKM